MLRAAVTPVLPRSAAVSAFSRGGRILTTYQTAPSARRTITTAPRGPYFCFDIDGVLKQGSHVLPQAKAVLQVLSGNNPLKRRYPFLCVTNGGGSLESERCKKLTKELEVEIGEHQIVQSHTVFRSLVPQYADKPVLVVGGIEDRCRRVAEAYGFKHAYIPADVLAWKSSVWPYYKLTEHEWTYVKHADFSHVSFAAILVFHDSRDWGRDVQLVLDLVRAKDGVFGTSKNPKDPSQWTPERQIPVHFSNPDVLWGNEFSQPRFGQGALQESMAAVYKLTTGHELQRTTGGKPTNATYTYAAHLLSSQISHLTSGAPINLHPASLSSAPSPPGCVYMIGDNPASDIAGANAFGWESILVKTGVFRGEKREDAEHVPTTVAEDVWEGVKWALEREGEEEAISRKPGEHETVTKDGPRE
ncbi:cardiolipin synthase [Rhodotorula toruloides]|uniref:Cardiolipin synthase n=1 Tax=Rhodotorula toruloides TaxID=5286 RepID=A0A511KJQ7_RHOTO|nr:cardiolipin synthase [Rhodotorula toruloides]